MARIEGIQIRNYRVLKDVTLGKLWNTQKDPLTPLTAVIGKNGVGKSSLFDAFGFLADCLKLGVEEACDARGRGGFQRICSKGVMVLLGLKFITVRNHAPGLLHMNLRLVRIVLAAPMLLENVLGSGERDKGMAGRSHF